MALAFVASVILFFALRSLPAYAQQCAARLLTAAARFPVGTVVEYRSGTFQRRPRCGERETR